MKKSICILLSALLCLLCCVGCGKTDNMEPETNGSANASAPVQTESDTKKQEKAELDFNTETYRVPVNAIYIELPSSPYHLVEMGYTKAAFIYDEQCISITGNHASGAVDLEQAQKDNIEEYALSVDNQMHIDSLTVSEDEYITINGIEMYRFEGEFNCYNETIIGGQAERTPYTQYAVGYTFIMDGVPCSLIGTVMNRFEEQPDSVKKDVEEKVDALIQTLRSEP